MPRHAAFLRAINVGGRRITNDRLAAAVEAVGFTDVSTFLASGNVIYEAGDHDPASAGEQLEVGMQEHLGFASEAFVRTAGDLDGILEATPFEAEALTDAVTKPQIVFLRGALDAATAGSIHALATDDDQLRLIGSELHWLPMKGVGRADLDWKRLGPLLGVSTVRNINTVRRIRPKLG